MSQAEAIQAPNSIPRKPLTAERLRELLHYDPATGIWRWRIYRPSRKAGSIAGCTNCKGYLVISIDYRVYRSNRLAVLYMTGKWPEHHVDHKDRTPGHDWWDNLREATRSQNQGNRRKNITNTSGFKGVSWSATDKKWRASIGKSGFIGVFSTREEAHEAYCKAAIVHFGEFARFE